MKLISHINSVNEDDCDDFIPTGNEHNDAILRELYEKRMEHRKLLADYEDRHDEEGNEIKKRYPLPEGKTILDYKNNPPNGEDNLLGNRFLCRQGSMLFVAQSGIGKSSASVQQDILWSMGKPAFGIKPSRPLQILTIQAEDDDGDMHEFINGIISTLQLTNEEVMLAAKNIHYIPHKELTGLSFLTEIVEPLLDKYKPDILRLNPFQAYLGADIANPLETAKFLRNTLNPLLKRFNCGCIIVHHTPKTTYQNKEEWKTSDWMYACTGCADLTNWARAILVVAAIKGDDKMFAMVAAKRGNRVEWADDKGASTCLRHFKHSDNGSIAWCDVDDVDLPIPATTKVKVHTEDEILEVVPVYPIETLRANLAIIVQERLHVGENKAKGYVTRLINMNRVDVIKYPRHNSKPAEFIRSKDDGR